MALSVADLSMIRACATLTPHELETLAASGERVEFGGAGAEITQQGDFGHSVYAVLEGEARVVVDGQEVGRLSAGDVFGEIAVVMSGRRTATVESLGAMVLASFFKRDIWALEKSNPGFADALRALRPTDDKH